MTYTGGYDSVWTESALFMYTYCTYSQGWIQQTLFYAGGRSSCPFGEEFEIGKGTDRDLSPSLSY